VAALPAKRTFVDSGPGGLRLSLNYTLSRTNSKLNGGINKFGSLQAREHDCRQVASRADWNRISAFLTVLLTA